MSEESTLVRRAALRLRLGVRGVAEDVVRIRKDVVVLHEVVVRAQIRGADLGRAPRAREVARVGTHLQLRERANYEEVLVAPA